MIIAFNDLGCPAKAIEILKKGGIGIIPCDTIYGLVGLAPHTKEKLQKLKGRDQDKPFLILIENESWIYRFSDTPLPEILKPYWPGPLTILFPDRLGGKIGLRVPDDSFLQHILNKLAEPLFSTSVNQSGEPYLGEIKKIIEAYSTKVDLIIDKGDLCHSLPSTIIDITVKPFRLIRQGALTLPPSIFS